MKQQRKNREQVVIGNIYSDSEKVNWFASNANKPSWIKWIEDTNKNSAIHENEKFILNNIYSTEKRNDKYSTRSLLNSAAKNNPLVMTIDYDDYCDMLYKMIKRDVFEIGYDNETTRYVRREVLKDRDYILKALQQVITKHSTEDNVWIAILHILSDLTYEESEPYGLFIAGSCLSKKNIEIKEMAIMLFEQWSNDEALNFLRGMETGLVWLDKYIHDVIKDIELEMNIDGVSSKNDKQK